MKKIDWEVGQEVHADRYGKGIIIRNEPYGTYPIIVSFDGYRTMFTSEGKETNGDYEHRVLFHKPRIITDDMLYPPVWEPKLNEIYYFFTTSGTISYIIFNYDTINIARKEVGNCFENEEKAKKSDYFKFFEDMREKQEEKN